jgi:simple sugar transport system ATP-binding protein
MNMGTLIKATDASMFYGPTRVLTDISLQIEPGRVLCLLGDNGADKSTLIKILSGVTPRHPARSR